MTSQEISYNKLPQALKAAFAEDKKIVEFYDPLKDVKNTDDVINDVHRKISTFQNPIIHAVYDKNELVGYFVYMPQMLISFGLNVKCRVRNKLREFFRLIRKSLGTNWGCLLYSKNVRAIKWMRKMGLKIIDTNPVITALQFE